MVISYFDKRTSHAMQWILLCLLGLNSSEKCKKNDNDELQCTLVLKNDTLTLIQKCVPFQKNTCTYFEAHSHTLTHKVRNEMLKTKEKGIYYLYVVH